MLKSLSARKLELNLGAPSENFFVAKRFVFWVAAYPQREFL
jgi:hypothetical protein